ncbi:prolyl-tRNA synthetase [Candidatus Nomurabacteria bacterium RIFCSPLOWO2_02_40_28]|uniref:Proline--tRNA ligase n=2 Tax=Candidatus Nomuraibacteriota TaxID=1752729 RepID=A0A837HS30_9BACT|nr:MAG: Prolyl-tRNA synthetase [Candidatus Nomurabacteria bacterium GW2011_GWD2_39_12]KKR20547.1 MAG: Prolyl-tRNA synthetase [Candidatus Nomurabacteria bacterium GW2011_GWC2_39_41]KKR36332.1 MAG: Prolyl-tRNA synthetase [Candidatus Nomurabacteria bacterium GW2011_GWE2_40_10]KKR38427.1 MAG: Prolyl-tRNA synthetase [Candidatus Nomurabacteria bacterium GW2011_GWB1_40_11]KKR39636.1 MAG: Prolyl-tRNA synthetase [Parcubacteria group bacterium GW2011_GWC1_40_11]KKR59142.1 MAG: Prolyl-tRNA synthetase [Ca
MLQSKLFTKTRKEVPADEVSRSAELLIRGGFINKEMAGVYDYLPLGLRVLKKIENIIRQEMDAIGGQEIIMSSLQRQELWQKHFNQDRWDDAKVDIWFKTKLKDGSEKGLAFTHEEPISNMMEQFVYSYRDLPFSVYQFQTKFRNELRAKSGIMRTREFVMKDLYSFSRNEKEHLIFYEKAKQAYINIFKRIGIGHITYLTFASGGVFSKFSHEFQTVTPSGEDTIYINEENNIAINKEVFTDEVKKDLELGENFKEEKSVEVGNIFTLGTKFSEPHLLFEDEKGGKSPVFMGSYGIGPARLMGTVVEVLSDDKGIIWPESIAPYTLHLLVLGENEKVFKEANKIYESLLENNIEVLFDDRTGISAGEKFADSDLLGLPYRAVVSERSMKEGGIELKKRTEEKGKIISLKELCSIKFTN